MRFRTYRIPWRLLLVVLLPVLGPVSVAGAPGAGVGPGGKESGSAAGSAVLPVLRRSLPLPGVEGRIDHLALGAQKKRLFVAALGNNTVEVLNLTSGTVAATIPNLAAPQGVAVAPDLNRLAVTNAGDGSCRIYDATTLRPLGSVDLKDDADNIRYDSATHEFWVGCGDGALALIDPKKVERVAEVRLPGHPESFQLEKRGDRIFVNVPGSRAVIVVDRKKMKTVAQWPLSGAGSNFPMALDEADHRLFIGCRRPARLLVLDTTTGAQVVAVELMGDCDDLFFDAATKRVYASGGAGQVEVIAQETPDKYHEIGRVQTGAGARTSLFDPASGTLYVAVRRRPGQNAQIRIYSVERGGEPGSR